MHVDSILITKNGRFFNIRKELYKKNEDFYKEANFRKATNEEIDAYAKKKGLIHEEEE